ncbi:MAG: xanthine dehydrogenase family protein molybdopterin-binding subunit, partial [Streptosporangiaceae bacterium]
MSHQAPRYNGRWIGVPVPRKEDRRMLLGRGRFVADLGRPGLLHAAFVRSPYPHARLTGIDAGAAVSHDGVAGVFTAASLGHPHLLAMLERDEFVPTRMPILAWDRVRFVGEPVALVVADDAYLAEDAAEDVEVDWASQPAVTGIAAARAADAPRLHEEADGNCLVDLLMFDDDRLAGIFAGAALTVGATFSSAR